MSRFCGKEMKEYIPRGWDYVEVTVKCGNTSPTGEPWMCNRCAKANQNVNWRHEAALDGVAWDENDY